MSKKKSRKEIERHRDRSIQKVELFLNKMIQDSDVNTQNKADKFSYWLEDYISFLEFEKCFDSKKMRKYKRGEIVKVHLGYNIGSEEGGLHYCVVMDKDNPLSSPVLTVIPLTSVKSTTDINHLRKSNIYLGNELFQSLKKKLFEAQNTCTIELKKLQKIIDSYKETVNSELEEEIDKGIKCETRRLKSIQEMNSEILKMEKGSIALVNQITTISKIRIYNPKTNKDILSGIRLPSEKLDLLDEEILKCYTNASMKK